MNQIIDEIIAGSFDLHVHAYPDSSRERRTDAIEAGKYAYEYGMGGFVLKSHDYPTGPLSMVLNQIYPGIFIAGGIVLNQSVGGLNPRAVEKMIPLNTKIVWMPTRDAQVNTTQSQINLIDSEGKLKKEVLEILELIATADIAIASGHVSPKEAIALFKTAKTMKIKRMIATHPFGHTSESEIATILQTGAKLEFTFMASMPIAPTVERDGQFTLTPMEMANEITKWGPENCIVTTDFGQWYNPHPAEGLRLAVSNLLHCGLDEKSIKMVVKDNPRWLLGLKKFVPIQEIQ